MGQCRPAAANAAANAARVARQSLRSCKPRRPHRCHRNAPRAVDTGVVAPQEPLARDGTHDHVAKFHPTSVFVFERLGCRSRLGRDLCCLCLFLVVTLTVVRHDTRGQRTVRLDRGGLGIPFGPYPQRMDGPGFRQRVAHLDVGRRWARRRPYGRKPGEDGPYFAGGHEAWSRHRPWGWSPFPQQSPLTGRRRSTGCTVQVPFQHGPRTAAKVRATYTKEMVEPRRKHPQRVWVALQGGLPDTVQARVLTLMDHVFFRHRAGSDGGSDGGGGGGDTQFRETRALSIYRTGSLATARRPKSIVYPIMSLPPTSSKLPPAFWFACYVGWPDEETQKPLRGTGGKGVRKGATSSRVDRTLITIAVWAHGRGFVPPPGTVFAGLDALVKEAKDTPLPLWDATA